MSLSPPPCLNAPRRAGRLPRQHHIRLPSCPPIPPSIYLIIYPMQVPGTETVHVSLESNSAKVLVPPNGPRSPLPFCRSFSARGTPMHTRAQSTCLPSPIPYPLVVVLHNMRRGGPGARRLGVPASYLLFCSGWPGNRHSLQVTSMGAVVTSIGPVFVMGRGG